MYKFLCVFCILIILGACTKSKEQDIEIDARLNNVSQLIAQNNLEEAKAEIDSIHKHFPRKIDKRRVAAALSDTISLIESRTTLAFAEQTIPQLIARADSLRKNFRYEKEENYQDFGNFVYKTQITEQNITRNYLKCFIDEQSNIFLVSNITGQRLRQAIIKLTIGELFVVADTTNNKKGVFHSFTDEGQYWETITFKNDAIISLAAFVDKNIKERINVEVIGTKTFKYQLGEGDKKAITETYRLWNTMREIKILEFEVEKANARTLKIMQREALKNKPSN
jgi:hypothetical protein